MASNGDAEFEFKLYRYTPSLAAAVIFLVLFVFATVYHLYQVTRARCWYFVIFVIGGVCKLKPSTWQAMSTTPLFLTSIAVQIIGYICRVLAHYDKESVPVYSVSTIMVLLAPPLYAASIYMTLGRLVTYLDAESLSVVPVIWLTPIFVTGDVIAFVMQAAGNYSGLPHTHPGIEY